MSARPNGGDGGDPYRGEAILFLTEGSSYSDESASFHSTEKLSDCLGEFGDHGTHIEITIHERE